jgi:hypothetical protein
MDPAKRTHVGAEAGVSVGAGVGANYLTGGFNGKLSLQPTAVKTSQASGWISAGENSFSRGFRPPSNQA